MKRNAFGKFDEAGNPKDLTHQKFGKIQCQTTVFAQKTVTQAVKDLTL